MEFGSGRKPQRFRYFQPLTGGHEESDTTDDNNSTRTRIPLDSAISSNPM